MDADVRFISVSDPLLPFIGRGFQFVGRNLVQWAAKYLHQSLMDRIDNQPDRQLLHLYEHLIIKMTDSDPMARPHHMTAALELSSTGAF